MPGNFSYLSILNPGFTAPAGTSSIQKGAGEFAYVSFLNPPVTATTATVTGGGTNYFFSNANNVSFGTNVSTVTAIAGPQPRSAAWSVLGAYIGTTSPGPGVQYSEWLAGSTGYFMWVNIP